MHDATLQATTLRYEVRRAVASGILETAATTFLLLIAVRGFDIGATGKALIAAGGQVGFLGAPLVVRGVEWLRWTPSGAASLLFIVQAAAFLGIALVPVPVAFVAGSIVALAAGGSTVPLITQIYKENYPDQMRGRLFSKGVTVRIGTAVLFSEVGGRLLSLEFTLFRVLLLLFCASSLFAAYCLARCPSRVLGQESQVRWFRGLRYVYSDRLFRSTLIAWMLMGFGNLMMVPLRVEYLANPRYGLSLTIAEISLLNGVLPNAARFVLSPVWGYLFDRINFFKLRILVNLGFLAGIISFFTSGNTTGLVLGALIFGASGAGGDIAWNLWVTKFAPPGRTAEYMGIHSFFTGLRGVIAPLVAFHALEHWSIETLAVAAAVLIVLACIFLLVECLPNRQLERLVEVAPSDPV